MVPRARFALPAVSDLPEDALAALGRRARCLVCAAMIARDAEFCPECGQVRAWRATARPAPDRACAAGVRPWRSAWRILRVAAALCVVALILLVLLTAIAMARHARLGPSLSSPAPNPSDRMQVERSTVEAGRQPRDKHLGGGSFPAPRR
jgi:hypothetical protein